MKRLVALILFSTAIAASPAAARNGCPPDKLGPHYPWLIPGILPGDTYAEVFADFDKDGQPAGCRIGKNNLSHGDSFNVCLAFAGMTMKPTSETGIPLPTTIKRMYMEVGGKHRRAMRDARKKYFQEHPYERSECYPQVD
jgi:hypothetical protein